ncbi:hypothetical protein ES708_01438 [subsurface metagenome]
MKCPLFCIGDRRVQLGEETEYGDCLKEECAWWVETQDRCAVKDIALSLDYVATDMTQILEKLLPARE